MRRLLAGIAVLVACGGTPAEPESQTPPPGYYNYTAHRGATSLSGQVRLFRTSPDSLSGTFLVGGMLPDFEFMGRKYGAYDFDGFTSSDDYIITNEVVWDGSAFTDACSFVRISDAVSFRASCSLAPGAP